MLVGFSHGVVSKAQTGSSETFHVGMRVCVRVCYTNHLRLCSRAWHCTLHCVVMCSRRPLTFFWHTYVTQPWRVERSVRARAFASLELRTWDFSGNRALTHFTVTYSRWRHLKMCVAGNAEFHVKTRMIIWSRSAELHVKNRRINYKFIFGLVSRGLFLISVYQHFEEQQYFLKKKCKKSASLV